MKRFALAAFLLILLRFFVIPTTFAQGTVPNSIYLPVAPKAVATATPTVIPTPTLVPATPTPISPVVIIKSHRGFMESDSYYVVGEVANNTAATVYRPRIDVRFYDASNQLIAVETGYGILSRLPSGGKDPFSVILFDAPNNIARYELTLAHSDDGILDYRAITVLSQQVRDRFGVEVFGEVRNDTGATVRPAKLAVTFYDAAGNVTDVDYGYTSGDLAPGQTAIYSVATFDEDLVYDSYHVQAESYLVP